MLPPLYFTHQFQTHFLKEAFSDSSVSALQYTLMGKSLFPWEDLQALTIRHSLGYYLINIYLLTHEPALSHLQTP